MRLLAMAFFTLGGLVACAATVPPPAIASAPAPIPAPPAAPAATPEPAPSPAPPPAPEPLPAPPPAPTSTSTSACNEQPPQDFLIRSNFLKEKGGNQRAIQWRTEHYGWFREFGRPGPDPRPPSAFVVDATFMGLPVRMHQKVVPALQCVEEEIKLTCGDHPYKARALAGIRNHNTYRGGEVTNHIFGIAVDVDPAINTCCGCVPPWNDAPACRRPAKTEYDRMAMPECWVHAFEKYGFYWLGHDVLRDTMHYEFLGDPDHIVRGSAPMPAAPATVPAPLPPLPGGPS
jgi:D-alanyl-D-alanine carboxypeptidase